MCSIDGGEWSGSRSCHFRLFNVNDSLPTAEAIFILRGESIATFQTGRDYTGMDCDLS